jgi:hypothetical protein
MRTCVHTCSRDSTGSLLSSFDRHAIQTRGEFLAEYAATRIVSVYAKPHDSSCGTGWHTTVYFVVVRLVLINRISLQHCRPVDYVQEPNAEPVSSRRNLLGETDMSSCYGLLIGCLDCEPLSSASRALWSGGSAFAAQGSGRLPAPACLAAPPLSPGKSGPGLCFPSPEISRGGHGIWNMESGLLTDHTN